MSSWPSFNAGAFIASIVGKDRNDTKIIKLLWWYTLCDGLGTLFFGFLLAVLFF